MPTFNHIGGAEPSTLTFKVATVSQTINSSVMHKEVLVLGDPDTSNAIAAVLASTPASTAWGLVTRPMGTQTIQGNSSVWQGSSAWQVQVTNTPTVTVQGNSTVLQGTSPWTIAGNSSVWQGSSAWQVQVTSLPTVTIQGNSTVVIASGNSSVIVTSGNSSVIITSGNSSVWQGSTAWQVQVTSLPTVTIQGNSTVVVASGNSSVIITSGNSSVWQGSSAWQVQVTNALLTHPVSQNSTVWQVQSVNQDNLGNGIESSTRAVGTNSTMRGIAVRQIMPTFLTTASSNVFASTTWTIATSNAATIQYVYAYSITTTNQTPTKIGFYAGSTLVWPIVLAAISSAVSGVNLAVSPPAYLFAGATGAILQMKTASASTGGGYKAGVSYWTE